MKKKVAFTIPFPAILILLFIAPACCAAKLPEAKALTIGSNFRQANLARHTDVLRDPTNQLTIDDVSGPPWSERFKRHTKNSFSYGRETPAIWFRFRLARDNDLPAAFRMILVLTRVIVDELDLYVPVQAEDKEGKFRRLRARLHSLNARDDLGEHFPSLVLPPDFKSDSYIYLRARVKMACYNINLFSQRAFSRHSKMVYLFYGVTTGVMLAMLLYNMCILALLHDRVYFWYCIYIFIINCYAALLSGWPVGLFISGALQSMLVLKFFSASFFSAMYFSRRFLDTPGKHKIIDSIFLVAMAMSAAVFIMSMVTFKLANLTAHVMTPLASLSAIASAFYLWRSGFGPARYYLAAWVALFTGAIAYSCSAMGLFGYSFLSANSVSIGAAAESVLLSFALADRIRILREERAHLQEKERRLTKLSITDELTGLFNKRWFSSKLISEMDHARRLENPLSLLMADVDFFKKFNDEYGHAAGDKVLAELGRAINESTRQKDIPCRYGGEEFAIILPGADLEKAREAAERLRKNFEARRVELPSKGMIGATISLGVARMLPEDNEKSLFERADQALYLAKEQGRNRVAGL